MDWDKLKVFYTVARFGNLSKASILLDASQSAISRQISGLENMLNTQLFYRHSTGLTLTEQGETLFRTTREIVSELTLTERQIKYKSTEVEGPLSLVAPVAFGTSWVLPKVNEFLQLYPNVSVTMKFCDTAVDLITMGVDASISGVRGDDNTMVNNELVTFPLGVYSSKEYLLQYGVPLDIRKLDHHKIAVFGEGPYASLKNNDILLTAGRPKEDPRRPFLTINSMYTLGQMVANGLGIAVLPRDVAEFCPGLIQILPEFELPGITFYYSYPRQLSELRPITAFYHYLSEQLDAQGLTP